MKITKEELANIIKEEVEKIEDSEDTLVLPPPDPNQVSKERLMDLFGKDWKSYEGYTEEDIADLARIANQSGSELVRRGNNIKFTEPDGSTVNKEGIKFYKFALRHFERACKLGDKSGCNNVKVFGDYLKSLKNYTPGPVRNENKTMKITKEELANIIKEEVEKALEQKDDKVKMVIAYMKMQEERELKKLQVYLDAVKNRPDSPEKTQKILDYSEQMSNISNKYMRYTKGVLEGKVNVDEMVNKYINTLPPQVKKEIQRRASELKDLKMISF